MAMNCANIFGRLARDPEMYVTQSGKHMTGFVVAVDRRKRTGEEDAGADFISCTAWESTADFLKAYAKKGWQIAVSGRIHVQKRTGQDGRTVWVTEIVANDVNLVFPPKEGEARAEGTYGEVRYGTPRQSSSVGSYGRNLDVSDVQGDLITSDDLPF